MVLTRFILPLAILTFSIASSYAQEPDLLWSKAYGGEFWEKGYAGTPVGDGFILVGYTESFGAGESDLYLVRVDGSGDTIWTRTYGGPQPDEGYSIEQTADGGFIVGGHFANESEESRGRPWILKLDAAGEMSWPYQHAATDHHYRLNQVRETAEGNFIVVGTALSLDFTTSSGWVAMLDAQGQPLWSKTFTPEFGAAFTSVDVTEDNGFAVVGFLGVSNVDVDAWLLRFDPAGDTIWTKTYGGQNGDAFSAIRVREDGAYVCVGTSTSFGQGDADILFVELKKGDPDSLWLSVFGGPDRDYGNSVLTTEDGATIIGGTTERPNSDDFDMWILRIDGEMSVQWASRYGGTEPEDGGYVYPTQDGGYWLLGSTESSAAGPSDAWLLRLSTDPVSGVENESPTTGGLRFDDPAPNPFDQTTAMRWHLDRTADVTVAVQDVLGRPVQTLMDDKLSPGTYSVEWNGLDASGERAPEGAYFCVVSLNGKPLVSRKVILTR